jgi:HAE1 family hydrophobic/amphiphilic exporter-1
VSITVIPMLSSRLLSIQRREDGDDRPRGFAALPPFRALHAVGGAFSRAVHGFIAWLLGRFWMRLGIAVVVTVVSVGAAISLAPPLDYLPAGNRSMVMWFVITQPGQNVNRADEMLRTFEQRILPQPEVENFFGVGSSNFFFMGALVKDEYSSLDSMRATVDKFQGLSFGIPGVRFPIVTQPPIFAARGGFVGGTNLEVVLRGPDLGTLEQTAGMMEGMLWKAKFDGALNDGINIVQNSFEPGNPELQIHVNRERATARGLRVTEVGDAVETLVEGRKAGVFREAGKELDLVVKGGGISVTRTQDLSNLFLLTPQGEPVRLDDVAEVRQATGPTKVDHTDLDRSIKLTVNLKREVPLGEAMEFVEKEVVQKARAMLPPDGGYTIDLRGQAEDLQRTFDALQGSFLLALIITYLLMAALFESFINPIVILFSVPLAATGGVIGLAISHAFEPTVKLDTITMLGFILLIGIVVNNAILIVHQTLNNLRAGMKFEDGLKESVRTRIRPIFMSTTTSVFGMLPLVLAGGKGSEIYRGLGSVVVGGLALSTIFTLVLVPVVFSLFVDLRRVFEKLLGWKTLEEVTAEDRRTAKALEKHAREA